MPGLRLGPTRLLAAGGLTLIAFLYWKPLHTYAHTRSVLDRRQADVARLEAEQQQLKHRLANVGTGDDLIREARRMGLVKPGERLFIVRGIAAWRRHHYPRGMDDWEIVERQLGRSPRAFRRVAVRCPFGLPAVTEQAPFDREGTPFPTEFWLTCPHLAARIARLEAAGGVERWTAAAAADRTLAASLASAHAEQRALRPELRGGVGGTTRGGGLKCLHAHAAFALARPGYLLGDLILADAGPLWPQERCCSSLSSK